MFDRVAAFYILKTRTIISIAFCFLVTLCKGQVDSSDFKDHSLYLYKTEDDFFAKRRVYRGQYIPTDDKKVITYSTINSKKRVLDLGDSCMYYFAYEIGDEIQIRPDKNPANFTYYSFGGGNKDQYCVVYGHLPNYDRKGYLLGLTSPAGMIFMYFVDKANHRYMVTLPEFLSSKPLLLAQYKAEKTRTNKEEWERNRLAIGIKYLKLVIGEKK